MPEIVVHELYNIIIIEENIGLTVYVLHSRPIIVLKNSLLPEIYGKRLEYVWVHPANPQLNPNPWCSDLKGTP